ncbi:MAG: Wzz/FepE/Etk N-terminal domain-containing protein [Staphylococcus epidermidis]|nr:Wzz/FepE/Etk N-terminal domain-containing protein [Staphylococcus epidermidis]
MQKQEVSSLEELNKIFKILMKHIKLIITTTILVVAITAMGLFFVVKPKYQATSEIIVNQKLDRDTQVTEQQQAQSADLQLVNTYKSILNSQTIGNAVRNKVGRSSYSDSSLNVLTDTSSQVISINVISHNAKNAANVANATAKVFKTKIKSIMNVNNVSIISKAQEVKRPISPKKGMGIMAGVFVGVVFGIFLAILKEYNDKTVSSSSFIEDELDLIDLGTISDIDMKNISKQMKNRG